MRYAEIEFPCLVPLSNLEYYVVLPPLITYKSGVFIKICIHSLNSLPNYFFFSSFFSSFSKKFRSLSTSSTSFFWKIHCKFPNALL